MLHSEAPKGGGGDGGDTNSGPNVRGCLGRIVTWQLGFMSATSDFGFSDRVLYNLPHGTSCPPE